MILNHIRGGVCSVAVGFPALHPWDISRRCFTASLRLAGTSGGRSDSVPLIMARWAQPFSRFSRPHCPFTCSVLNQSVLELHWSEPLAVALLFSVCFWQRNKASAVMPPICPLIPASPSVPLASKHTHGFPADLTEQQSLYIQFL